MFHTLHSSRITFDSKTVAAMTLLAITLFSGARAASNDIALTTADGAAVVSNTRDYEILWHRYLPDPIYLTTGLSNYAQMVFAGNYLNPPMEAEALRFDGAGAPDWIYPGAEFYTDGARGSDVLAGINCVSGDSSVTAMEWRSGSATPLWSYRIHPCRPLTAEGWSQGKGVQVSDDGSTIAFVVNMYAPGGLNGRLCIFDRGSGAPATVYDLPSGTASALQVTPDGAYVAIYAWPYIYVYDRFNDVLRWSGAAGSGNDALAISGDGRYIAWGWSTLNLRQWNGTTYQPFWSASHSGYYLTECALSPGNNALALAWYSFPSFDDTLIEMYALPSLALSWTYHYQPLVSDRPTDVVSELVFSPDGSWMVAPSWGGFFPELHVFNTGAPEPALIFDTPGTMFDADIDSDVGGNAYITACGKHVHAGQSGRGGDLYAIWIIGGDGVDDGESPGAFAGLRCSPNPTALDSRIEFSLPTACNVRLNVHDLQGRVVARLMDQFASPGSYSLDWPGSPASGSSLHSGVYLLKLSAGGRTETKAVLVTR